jgi:hypothetical protein
LNDDEPLIRGACAWALGNYPMHVAQPLLDCRRAAESDNTVLLEIDAALAQLSQEAAFAAATHC